MRVLPNAFTCSFSSEDKGRGLAPLGIGHLNPPPCRWPVGQVQLNRPKGQVQGGEVKFWQPPRGLVHLAHFTVKRGHVLSGQGANFRGGPNSGKQARGGQRLRGGGIQRHGGGGGVAAELGPSPPTQEWGLEGRTALKRRLNLNTTMPNFASFVGGNKTDR